MIVRAAARCTGEGAICFKKPEEENTFIFFFSS